MAREAFGGDFEDVRELAGRLLPLLQRRLKAAFPRVADDMRHDAAVDALVDHWRSPDRYDGGRGVPLEAFLYHAARRNVIDACRSDIRRRARECAYAQIADSLVSSRWRIAASALHHRLVACSAAVVSGIERSALLLWAAGEDALTIAAALHIGELPVAQQRAEVKRFKDRMIKRLRRVQDGRPDGL